MARNSRSRKVSARDDPELTFRNDTERGCDLAWEGRRRNMHAPHRGGRRAPLPAMSTGPARTPYLSEPPPVIAGGDSDRLSAGGGSEPEHAEGWQRQRRGRRLTVPGFLGRLDRAEVADAAAGITLCVGVEDLLPLPGAGQPDAVALVRHPREVADDRHARTVRTPAQERQHVADVVVGVDPREALGLRVLRP